MKKSFNLTNTEYLDTDIILGSSILRTIIHLIVIPIIIAMLGFAFLSVIYIALISYMHIYRCKLAPTEENILRKETFFSIISFLVISISSVLVFFILISLI